MSARLFCLINATRTTSAFPAFCGEQLAIPKATAVQKGADPASNVEVWGHFSSISSKILFSTNETLKIIKGFVTSLRSGMFW